MTTRYYRAGKAFAFLAISVASFWPAASTALSQPLLKPGIGAEPLAIEQRFKSDRTLKRKRLVEIDRAVLEKQILPKGADKSPDRAERSAKLKGEVTLQLFDDVSVTLKVKQVEDAFDGGVVWNATAGGNNSGILVVNNGKVTGSIEYDGRSFLIEPAGHGNSHRVREVSPDAFPNDIHMAIPKNGKDKKSAAKLPATQRAGTNLVVKLLGAYTARANTILGGVPADKIALDVAIVNQGYVNSNVPLHLKLVGTVAISASYDERSYSDAVQPLYDITWGTGYNFAGLRNKRNRRAADVVTLYADRPEYCGVAWVNNVPPNADYAYSVINAACNGTTTLAHELGHNMTLHHDRYVEPAAPDSDYNYGFVSTAGAFRDIMSYNNQCSALGLSCTRITYYSTPAKSYNGFAVGIPAGTSGAADAARTLSEQAAAVAAFR